METITPDAADLQRIPTIPAATQRLIDLFDAAEALGYSMLTLFEASSPGATEALRLWAQLRGLEVAERSITPPGCPTVYITGVYANRGGGKLAAHIDVHRSDREVLS